MGIMQSQILQLLLLMVCLSAVSLQTLQSFPKLCEVRDFDDFLRQTGKMYPDQREREFRESIFLAKKSLIDLSNNRVSSYRLNLNILADMTRKEVSTLLGSKISFQGE